MHKYNENVWIYDVNYLKIYGNTYQKCCGAEVFYTVFFKAVIVGHGPLTFDNRCTTTSYPGYPVVQHHFLIQGNL